MRKMLFILIAAMVAQSSFAAGVAYTVDTSFEMTPEMQKQQEQFKQTDPEAQEFLKKMGLSATGGPPTMSFRCHVADGKARVEYLKDFLFFSKGTFMLADEKGERLVVANPETKTYFEMHPDEMQKQADAMAKQFKMEYLNPSVKFEPGLGTEIVASHKCRRDRLTVEYTTQVKVLGMTKKAPSKQVYDIWHTDSFLLKLLAASRYEPFRTGVAAVDAQISSAIAGKIGFPLKWTVETFDDKKSSGKMTGVVKDIGPHPAPASLFAVPADYKKTEFSMAPQGGAPEMAAPPVPPQETVGAEDAAETEGEEEEEEEEEEGEKKGWKEKLKKIKKKVTGEEKK